MNRCGARAQKTKSNAYDVLRFMPAIEDEFVRQRLYEKLRRPVNLDFSELPSPATSRFVHHDATGILPPITLHALAEQDQTFYG